MASHLDVLSVVKMAVTMAWSSADRLVVWSVGLTGDSLAVRSVAVMVEHLEGLLVYL